VKIIETKQVKQCYVKFRKCDICGKESHSADWGSGFYSIDETLILMRIQQRGGVSYPDGGGEGSEYDIDLCPDCFVNKLIPWLKSQGAEIKPKKWEC
jgi:hypothetical protein